MSAGNRAVDAIMEAHLGCGMGGPYREPGAIRALPPTRTTRRQRRVVEPKPVDKVEAVAVVVLVFLVLGFTGFLGWACGRDGIYTESAAAYQRGLDAGAALLPGRHVKLKTCTQYGFGPGSVTGVLAEQ